MELENYNKQSVPSIDCRNNLTTQFPNYLSFPKYSYEQYNDRFYFNHYQRRHRRKHYHNTDCNCIIL